MQTWGRFFVCELVEFESPLRKYHTKRKSTLLGGLPFGGLEEIRLINVRLGQALGGNAHSRCI